MNLKELKEQQKQKYIVENGLEQSHIDYKVLWQCRPLLPEVRIVGKDVKNNIIFFEETASSLQKRHYGKNKKVMSYNLLYNDGEITYKVTKEYLQSSTIIFNEGYDLNMLCEYLENASSRFNPLKDKKKKKCSFYLTEDEIEIVRQFVKKMRAFNK